MGSSPVLSDFLYPESTVTSLLSSSGHLRGSLQDPERTTTFRPRNHPERTTTFNYRVDPERTTTFNYRNHPEHTFNYRDDSECTTTFNYRDDPERTTTFNYRDDPERTTTFNYGDDPERTTIFNYRDDPERTTTFNYRDDPERTTTFNYRDDPERTTTFNYRDKEYESASAALNAYISDFERSHVDREPSVGRLTLPHSRPRLSVLRNKDVLRERLTDVELDFLSLPVSSLRHRGNRDRLSMTTDELLSVPNDGSMPVTHTSAFIHGLMSQSGPSFRPGPGPRRGLSSSRNQHEPHPIRTLRTCRFRGSGLKPHVDLSSTMTRLDPSVPSDVHALPHRVVDLELAEPESSTLHLPHWLTSHKAHMDCSEIGSIPELPYPAWIQHCDAAETPPEPQRWDQRGGFPVPPQRTMSWAEDLDHGPEQEDGHMTLRDIRLQFAQQISLLAAERQSCDAVELLFRENRIQSLIQKADQVLDSLSQGSSGLLDGPQDPCPVGLQDPRLDGPQDPGPDGLRDPGPNRLPVPGPDGLQDTGPDGLQDPGPDGLQDPGPVGLQDPATPVDPGDPLLRTSSVSDWWRPSVDQCPPSIRPGRRGQPTQPGPVEALKQMLFRLQAVEAELQRRRPPLAETQESDSDRVPGGPSLQRALHHLGRLKLLVDESTHKRTGEDQDPDLVRVQYSSSEFICTEQTTTE